MMCSVRPSHATVHRTVAFNLSNLLCTNTYKMPQPKWVGAFYGGLEEIRTPDPHNANVVRSQLRYKPISFYQIISLQTAFVKQELGTSAM